MMFNAEFNKKLISAIEKNIPLKSNQISLLISKIKISKEAAYRRLRGDVPFTFSEACILASELGFSLDMIAYEKSPQRPTFELQISRQSLLHNGFYSEQEYEKYVNLYTNESVLRFTMACNTMPLIFFLAYKNLLRFLIFKWKYLTEKGLTTTKLSNIVLPETVLQKQSEVNSKLGSLPENTFIFDRNIFKTHISELRYFHQLDLISDSDLSEIKKDFLSLLQRVEMAAIEGKTLSGKPVWMYLSNIDFECNYSYIYAKDQETACVGGIYLVDMITSTNPDICSIHRLWTESLKKYSTQISISGELERKKFFEQQRELIYSL